MVSNRKSGSDVHRPNGVHYYRRKVLGLSQVELSRLAELGNTEIGKIERFNGGSTASREKLYETINSELSRRGFPEITSEELWRNPSQYSSISIDTREENHSKDESQRAKSIDQDPTNKETENNAHLLRSNIGLRRSLVYSATMLIEPLEEFRGYISKDNYLSVNHSDVKMRMLDLLSRLISHMHYLVSEVPIKIDDKDFNSIDEASTWAEKTYVETIEEFKRYTSPESVGKIVAPTSITLGLGVIGSIFGGAAGFAAGTLVGNVVVGNAKSKSVTDRLEKSISESQGSNVNSNE